MEKKPLRSARLPSRTFVHLFMDTCLCVGVQRAEKLAMAAYISWRRTQPDIARKGSLQYSELEQIRNNLE